MLSLLATVLAPIDREQVRSPLISGKYEIINDRDWFLISKHKWYTKNCKNRFYARANLYIGRNKWFMLAMHPLIMNAPKGMQVDHINSDGLDNRRSNLRLCTLAENTRNSRKHSQNKSGYKGVWLNSVSATKPWTTAITFNRKYIHIGIFATAEEAALAYNKKALELFGEFASLNTVKM